MGVGGLHEWGREVALGGQGGGGGLLVCHQQHQVKLIDFVWQQHGHQSQSHLCTIGRQSVKNGHFTEGGVSLRQQRQNECCTRVYACES